jgi:hypothetical protein
MTPTTQKRFKTITAPGTLPLTPATPAPVAAVVKAPVLKRHVFEAAGLGLAPYKFLNVSIKGSSCQYCSTGIMYQFWLESADHKTFYVGSDCIYKSGDDGLRRVIEPLVKAHQAELKRERDASYIAQFEAYLKANPNFWATVTGPHPNRYYASQGKTMGDYQRFCYEHSGRSSKAKIARQILIGLGLVKATRKPKVVTKP